MTDQEKINAVNTLRLNAFNNEGRTILSFVAAGRIKPDYVYGLLNGLMAGLRVLGGGDDPLVGKAPFDELNEFEKLCRMPKAKLAKWLDEHPVGDAVTGVR